MAMHMAEDSEIAWLFHEPFVQTGALLEIDLAARLALTFRGGLNFQRRNQEFQDPTLTLTAGLAVY